MANIRHAEASVENTQSGKMADISISMCDNENLHKASCAQDQQQY